jgi:Pyridoxamine 5'-phosphate oxidase
MRSTYGARMSRRETTLRMWGRELEVPRIEWSAVEHQLREAEVYWAISVPPSGQPAPRPVWGAWLDDRLLLSVGSRSLRRGSEAHPQVTVHLGDPLSVVIVEGRAAMYDGPFDRYVEAYNAKYSWTFAADDAMVIGGTLEVVPTEVLAWTTVPVADCTPDMQFPTTAGRWTF